MSLYRRSPTGPYWYRFKVAGQTYRRSTGTTSQQEATKIERQARADIERTSARTGGAQRIDLAQLAEWDVDRAEAAGVTAKRIDQIERDWTHLARHLHAELEPRRITYPMVEAFVAARRQDGARGQTIRRELWTLKRGMEIARRRGKLAMVLQDWPTIRSDPPSDKRGHLIPIPILAQWLALLPDNGARAQAEFVLRTGLRAAEVRRVRASWVESAPAGSLVPAVLRLPAWATKSRAERIVGLTQPALDLVRSAPRGEQDSPLWPGTHQKATRSASEALGVPTISLRDLRHTHATLAAQGTGDAAAAQAALGHTELATTQRYLSSTIERTTGAAVAVDQAIRRTG